MRAFDLRWWPEGTISFQSTPILIQILVDATLNAIRMKPWSEMIDTCEA